MAAITASMVKELREMSGAGMMDCKKALTETDGDFDKAVELIVSKMADAVIEANQGAEALEEVAEEAAVAEEAEA